MTGPDPARRTRREVVFAGTVITVCVDAVPMEDGTEARMEVVRHPDAVTIVPLDAKGRVVMVRQHRHAAGRALLELPAGKIDEGELPAQAAQRELREETGLAAAALRPLGGFYAAPGILTEYLHLFVASGLTPSPLDPDPLEMIDVVRVPPPEARRMVARGEIQDAKTIAGLAMALGVEGAPGVV